MKKRNWFLLIILLLALTVWYYLFYKSYSNKNIAKSADVVLSIDVKRNANTILAYFLTTPSEWNLRSVFHFNKDTTFDWKDAVKIPDYVFVFHCKDQPCGVYYSVLEIKHADKFEQGLSLYGFNQASKENGLVEYYSDKLGIALIKKEDRFLISTIALKDSALINAVAAEIFNKDEYIATATLEKIISPANHFTIYIQQNSFLAQDAIINGNFKKGQLVINTSLQPSNQYAFAEDSFNISSQSLLNVVFTQPSAAVYSLLQANTKKSISTALNFNIDSLLSPENKKYDLTVSSIKTKIDSAVSYSFDDDFNKIEKVVVNKIQEPALNFTASGDNTVDLFQYWIKNKNIQQDSSGLLFVSIPFVKTYAFLNTNSLSLTSYNYTGEIADEHIKCIGNLSININKIPTTLLNYLPDQISKMISNLQSVNCIATKQNTSINIMMTINNKVADKPFLLSVK